MLRSACILLGCLVLASATTFEKFRISPMQGQTLVELSKGNRTVGNETFESYVITGKGPSWQEISGVGVFVVPKNQPLRISYSNKIDNETLIHIHGQTPPPAMDGVPYISTLPLVPGQVTTYTYDVYPQNVGTYWMHSHFGFQHEQGMAAPLIVEGDVPAEYPDADVINQAEDVVMFLEDFCGYSNDEGPSQNPSCFAPQEVFATLKAAWDSEADDFNFTECSDPGDGGDVSYKYQLANGRTLEDPIKVTVKRGASYRVRIISASAMTNYRVNFPINGTLIATDGQYVKPIAFDHLWVTVGQRFDVMFKIPESGSDTYPIFAIAEGTGETIQSGIILVVEGTNNVPSFSVNATNPGDIGFSEGIDQEAKLEAWFPLEERPADRTYAVNLTGDNGFKGINQASYQLPPSAKTYYRNPNALKVRFGERVCLEFRNFNADAHAMHLHGHSFQVVEINGQKVNGAMHDTVLVPRGFCQTVKVCFDADNFGTWPLHCHMTYHLAAGMLTTIEYEDDNNFYVIPTVNPDQTTTNTAGASNDSNDGFVFNKWNIIIVAGAGAVVVLSVTLLVALRLRARKSKYGGYHAVSTTESW
eukprot:Colp12_sorted_trinity150504_noHs@7250